MTQNGTQFGSTRILAVILTHERPVELQRCLQNALATLCSDDMLVVLDDSSLARSRANAFSLAHAARTSTARFCHLQAEKLQAEIGRAVVERGTPQWQRKTAPRDISPLRNLSLLISVAVGPETTVLVDDDIYSFDLNTTHQVCDTLDSPHGLIAGATIGNLSDLDTFTRLSNAMRVLASTGFPDTAEDVFRVNSGDDGGAADSGCVSAGYMAFRLSPQNLFAFPPGYNEDWLWCLLQREAWGTRIFRTEQEVLHDPLQVRNPTRGDIHFETAGDIIFDCLVDSGNNGRQVTPESALLALSDFIPERSTLPAARAEALVAQLRELQNEHGMTVLESLGDHGLSLLQEMLSGGELEVDGRTILSTWSKDAVAKHRSFAATIGTPGVLATVRHILDDKRK